MTVTDQPYADCVESLTGFTGFVEKHCAQFDHVLFRGQRRDWPLLPRLARLRMRYERDVVEVEGRTMSSLRSRAVPLLQFTPETEWD
jgi:hypothetical protein